MSYPIGYWGQVVVSMLPSTHHAALKAAGVFILVHRDQYGVAHQLYVGTSSDLSLALGPTHPQWSNAWALGMNEVHFSLVASSDEERAWTETYIRYFYAPKLNVPLGSGWSTILRLFCSHSWSYSEHRNGLAGLVDGVWTKNRDWVDFAVPSEHPLHWTNASSLRRQLALRIALCDVVVAFAGMYSSYSDWIEYELNTATWMRKPVLAIVPRGQERRSAFVMERATKVVGWNGRSIRAGILDSLPRTRQMSLSSSLWAEPGT